MLRADCLLLVITLANGQRYFLTNRDEDISVEGNLYTAQAGFTLVALKRSLLLEGDNLLQLELLANPNFDPKLAKTSRLQLLLAEATATGEYSSQLLFSGETINVNIAHCNKYQLTAAGLLYKLNHLIGTMYSRTCRACLGDKYCRVALAEYQVSATLSNVEIADNSVVVTYAAAAEQFGENYWRYGKLCLPNNLEYTIESSNGCRLILVEQLDTATVLPGLVVRLYPGCDHELRTCQTKFHNVANFRGEPHIPASETLVTIY